MSWPLSQDYNEAIQSPAANFSDPDLKRGQVVCNALGLPIPYSGNFADVYQVKCPDGSRWAVKCFTREAAGLRERYQEISKHLRQVKLPFTVDFTYLEQGIRVLGRWYPVLKMQWVEGLTLNQFVSQHLDKPAMLEALLHFWAKMARYLRAAGVGHCDLQHGNILLVPGANANMLSLKLIDYDGMWVPALAGNMPGEVGHPSYQHPQRIVEGTYSLEVDRFPVLLVATALRALKAGGRELWEKYDNGDNMLFTETDLREPKQSALIQELLHLGDPATTTLFVPFLKALYYGLEAAPLLEELLAEARPVAAPIPDPRLSSATVPAAPIQAIASESNPWTFGQSTSAASIPAVSREKRISARMIGVPVWAWAAAITLLVVSIGMAGSVTFWMFSGNPAPPLNGSGSLNVATPPPMLAEISAIVVLQIDQPGAEVSVDGENQAVVVSGNDKPVRIRLKPGQHYLSISKEGFKTAAEDLLLTTGQQSSRHVRLQPIDKPLPVELRITVVIDGKDELRVTRNETRWIHYGWVHPTQVKLNGLEWNPQATPVRANCGVSQLLGKSVDDLSKVRLTKVRGRGSVVLQSSKDFVSVIFDDPEPGSDNYEAVLTFDK